MRQTLKRRLCQFLAGLLGCLAGSSPGSAVPLSESDFGSAADRIGFDELLPGTELGFHLMRLGVHLRLDGGPLRVVDPTATAVVAARSAPLAMRIGGPAPKEQPLEMDFSSLRQKVGVFLGAVPAGTSATLLAFDESGEILDEVTVTVDSESTSAVASFLGLGQEEAIIQRATLSFEPAVPTSFLDDLLLEPAQESVPAEPWRSVLLALGPTREEKLGAIAALQVRGGSQGRLALEQAAQTDADPEVQERAALALAQVRDPASMAVLSALAQSTPTEDVQLAARGALDSLRRLFPLPDPAVVDVQVLGELLLGEEIDVEATVVSPVDRDQVRVRFRGNRLLQPIVGTESPDYRGPLSAGEPVLLRGRFRVLQPGTAAFVAEVRVSLDPVDRTTWRFPLYLQIDEEGGAASMTPPPGWDDTIVHDLGGE